MIMLRSLSDPFLIISQNVLTSQKLARPSNKYILAYTYFRWLFYIASLLPEWACQRKSIFVTLFLSRNVVSNWLLKSLYWTAYLCIRRHSIHLNDIHKSDTQLNNIQLKYTHQNHMTHSSITLSRTTFAWITFLWEWHSIEQHAAKGHSAE